MFKKVFVWFFIFPLFLSAQEKAVNKQLKQAIELEKEYTVNSLEKSLKILLTLYTEGNKSYEISWRIAKVCYDLFQVYNNIDKKIRIAKLGVKYGKIATQLNPRGVEGHNFLAINYGFYAVKNNLSTSLTAAKFVYEEAKKAYNIDKTFDGCGPIATLGRYYYEIPGHMNILLEKSYKYLKEAVNLCPTTTNLIFFAETLLAMGKIDEAKKYILLAEKTEPKDNEYKYAKKRDMKLAKELLKNIKEQKIGREQHDVFKKW